MPRLERVIPFATRKAPELVKFNVAIPPKIHTRELLWMRQAGLTNEEVLAALIRSPIVRDAPADLIALGSNPLEELTAFDDLRLVMRSGRVVTA